MIKKHKKLVALMMAMIMIITSTAIYLPSSAEEISPHIARYRNV